MNILQYKDIKENYPVYILDKKALSVRQGKVTAIAPHIDGAISTMANNGQLMRDITIDVGGTVTTYTIPENLSVTFAGSIVLSTTQEGLANEVERMKRESKEALAQVDHHQQVVDKAEELLAMLNPQVRERQETEKRFKSIEGDISGIRGMVKQLLDKLG